jgi:beta-mannosidase
MQKYSPNAGYFQFMWIDFSPQSFYGIYDYWGRPKIEGIGGGLRALNDSLSDLSECTAGWTVATESGEPIARGQSQVRLGPDSHVRVGDLSFKVTPSVAYRVTLILRAADGRELARNLYRDPFHHPPHPEGHPQRMDQEIGMRLWWAGEKD